LICLAGVVIYLLVRLARRAAHRRALQEMHTRDDERRALELSWFEANGQGMPNLAPHEWYETAEECDWDRARLTVLGFEFMVCWRRQREDGSIAHEVLYQRASRPAAAGSAGARGDLSRYGQLGSPFMSSSTRRGPLLGRCLVPGRPERLTRWGVSPTPPSRHLPPVRAFATAPIP
jgi:hypothetical protein